MESVGAGAVVPRRGGAEVTGASVVLDDLSLSAVSKAEASTTESRESQIRKLKEPGQFPKVITSSDGALPPDALEIRVPTNKTRRGKPCFIVYSKALRLGRTGIRMIHPSELVAVKLKDLGSGSFGTVELMKVDNKFFYAKKSIFIRNATELLLARREAHLGSVLDHPNIAKTAFQTCNLTASPHVLNMFQEFASNGSLSKFTLPDTKFLNNRQIFQLFSAINYMHSKAFVHLDLKPSNIGLDENLDIKVLDLGISRHISELTDIGSSQGIGTADYASYEALQTICRKDSRIGHKTDLASLGNTLIHLLYKDTTINLLRKALRPDSRSFATPTLKLLYMVKADKELDFSGGNFCDDHQAFMERFESEMSEFEKLIWSLISPNPIKRPSLESVLSKIMTIKIEKKLNLETLNGTRPEFQGIMELEE